MSNRIVATNIGVTEQPRINSRYTALFDPQTCGGLLVGVRESETDAVLARLAELSDGRAELIAHVIASEGTHPRLTI